MRKMNELNADYCFGKRLEEAMTMKGLDEKDFDDFEDVPSSSSIHDYIMGNRLPTLRNAIQLADFLGVSIDWLCGLGEKLPCALGSAWDDIPEA